MSSPAQLFSSVPANAILKSPVNNSTSKSHWSFSKSNRFGINKIYCDAIYDLPDTKSTRKTGMGYGKKTDLSHDKNPHNVTPSPDTYNLNAFTDINKLHKKGFFPGYGRQQTAPRSYIQLDPTKVPGPGRYQHNSDKKKPYWSMRPRTASQLFPKTTQLQVPGPGQYQSKQNISSTGKYYTSKHKCSKSKVFNPKSSKRFSKSTTDIPGPGSYQPKNQLSGTGDYVLSQNVSSGKRTMLFGNRNSFIDLPQKQTQTPGPGSYRIPSQFGHYQQPIKQFTQRKSFRKASTRPNTARK